jgi:poly-gamma-glutamate synthesis protein (capsule biosynthesis protein)
MNFRDIKLNSYNFRTTANIAAFVIVIISIGIIISIGGKIQKPLAHERHLDVANELEVDQNPEILLEDLPRNESLALPKITLFDTVEQLTLIAVGDIMLDRGVGRRIANLGAYFPFENVAETLRNADLTFGNLESLMSDLGQPLGGKEVTFRANPQAVNGIKYAGVDVVSLANNHMVDYGDEALLETMDILAHSGIPYVGAGMNYTAAHRPAKFTVRDINVAFLAYSYRFWMVAEAQNDKPGVAVAPDEAIKKDIEDAKQYADIVVVSFHWGWEYSDHPDNETRELAHQVIDSGADLIIGHHPHVIQGVEVYNKGLICYSLGNFIFDQRGKRTTRGLIAKCVIEKTGVRMAEFLPVIISTSEFRPSLASGEIAESVNMELKKLSKQLGTEVEIEEDKAVVNLNKGSQEEYALEIY